MAREAMTSFGVPVDAGIAEHIDRIDALPKINTTYSCSGLRKDHSGVPRQPYLIIATNRYVGEKLGDSPRYPHETHRLSLKVYRAAIMAGWYASYTTTTLKQTSGIAAVKVSTQPSVVEYRRLLAGNVTGNPTATIERCNRSREKIAQERSEYFVPDESDNIVEEKWERLYEELHWELVENQDCGP